MKLTLERDRKTSPAELAKLSLSVVAVCIAAAVLLLPFIDPPEDHGVLSVGERATVRTKGIGYIEAIEGDSVRVRLDSGEVVTTNTFDVADMYEWRK